MLGRYVAGTLLVLGVAMVMAPPSPEPVQKETPVEVTRSEASPAALAAPKPTALPQPTAVVAESDTQPEVSNEGVEAAVLEALNLDLAEDSDRPEIAATDAEEPAAEVASVDPAATGVPQASDQVSDEEFPREGVLAGLSDPGFFTGQVGGTETVPTAAESPVPETATTPEGQFLFVTGNRVNVRSGPSTDYRVVGSVTLGQTVELLGIADDGWAQILIDNGTRMGFMSSKFLAEEATGG